MKIDRRRIPKHLNLTREEIHTLQYAIHCTRSKLEKQKKEKLTVEWQEGISATHHLHMRNLWNLEERLNNE